MKQPAWKKWLSYLMEIHLESLSSEFNEELHVYLSKGRYQLTTKNAVYSFDDLYVNFDYAFLQMNIKERKVEDVLILGLGLGSIPFMLENKYQVRAKYTVVELDEEIIYLAGKYSLSDLKSPIDYICTDAEAFVQVNHEQYDLVCMDIFADDVIPVQFETEGYLKILRNTLKPNGVLLFNRLASIQADIQKTETYYKNIFKKIFPEGYHYDVKGNWILVGER